MHRRRRLLGAQRRNFVPLRPAKASATAAELSATAAAAAAMCAAARRACFAAVPTMPAKRATAASMRIGWDGGQMWVCAAILGTSGDESAGAAELSATAAAAAAICAAACRACFAAAPGVHTACALARCTPLLQRGGQVGANAYSVAAPSIAHAAMLLRKAGMAFARPCASESRFRPRIGCKRA